MASLPDLSLHASAAQSVGMGQVFVIDLREAPTDPACPDGAQLCDLSETLALTGHRRETVSVTSTKVTGASATLIRLGSSEISGNPEFVARVFAEDAVIDTLTAWQTAEALNALYTAKRAQDPAGPLPLMARTVAQKGVYYAVISGEGRAPQVTLSHQPPEGGQTGFTLKIDGKEYSDIKINPANRSWTCGKAGQARPDRCLLQIVILDNAWNKTDTMTTFNARPASLDQSQTARLFRIWNGG